MPEKIILNENNKKIVKLNYSDNYYELLYDWPLDTIWNINGSLNEELNKKYRPEGVYIEIFTNTFNAKTYIGTHGVNFQECEKILWNKFQSYLQCQHEFIRESPKGKHYKDGSGFCKYCGMFATDVFEPEDICEICNKHANVYSLLNGKKVCEDCYNNQSWENQLGLKYFTPEKLMQYILNKKEQPLISCKEVLVVSNKNIKNKYINLKFQHPKNKPSWIQLYLAKREKGIWEVIDFKGENYYLMAKTLFGPSKFGNYLIEDNETMNVVNKKYKQLKEILYKNKYKDSFYVIKQEIESISKIQNQKIGKFSL